MRTLSRSLLVGLLIACLLESPVAAAPSPVLGVVTQAQRALVGSAEAVAGATVFDGDTLTTDASGMLRVRSGAAQVYLLADSAAVLRRTAGGVSAALARGTIVLSSSGAEAIELQASGARIRPLTPLNMLAQVTLVSPLEFLVTSQRGQLEVTIGEEVRTVPEATSYRVLIEPEAQDAQGAGGKRRPAGGPVRAARSRWLPITLALIAAGTGIGIWRALISPDGP